MGRPCNVEVDMNHTVVRSILWLVALLLAATTVVAACGGETTVAGGDDIPDDDGIDDDGDDGSGDAASGSATGVSLAGTWELSGLDVDGAPVDLPGGRPILITIALGEIEGDGGCNRFSGPIDRGDDGSLTVGPLTQTEMACEILDFEVTYTVALMAATSWEATPDTISFVSDSARITYTARPEPTAEAVPLIGTVWVLDSIYGPGEGPERAVSSIDMSAPGVEVVLDATSVSVFNERCTDVVFDLVLAEGEGGGSIEVLDGGGSQCEGMESENPNFDIGIGGLLQASGYLLDGDRLILIGEEGELIGFRAQ
jgi:heat shock protein HslJ